MTIDLEGKTALVTGASRGIGRAIALAYAAAGADVALLARNAELLEDVAAEIGAIGRSAVVLVADVTDPDAVATAVGRAISGLGHVDIVVNNAGGNSFMSPLVGMRYSGWQKIMALNLDSTVHVCQAVGPHLVERGGGSVINVASVAGLGAMPFMSHYGAAKAAVLSLTRSLAVEWAHAGVRVNALVPGLGRHGPHRFRAHQRGSRPGPYRPRTHAAVGHRRRDERPSGVPGERRVVVHDRPGPGHRRRPH